MGGFTSEVNNRKSRSIPDRIEDVRDRAENRVGDQSSSSSSSQSEESSAWLPPEPKEPNRERQHLLEVLRVKPETWRQRGRSGVKDLLRSRIGVEEAKKIRSTRGSRDLRRASLDDYESRADTIWDLRGVPGDRAETFHSRVFHLADVVSQEVLEREEQKQKSGSGPKLKGKPPSGQAKATGSTTTGEKPQSSQSGNGGDGPASMQRVAVAGLIGAVTIGIAWWAEKGGEEPKGEERENPLPVFRAVEPDTLARG